MSNGKRSWLLSGIGIAMLTGVVVLLAAGVLLFSAEKVEPLTIRNRLEAEWQSLDVTQRALQGRTKPEDWSAGAFIGSDALGQVVQQMVGYQLQYIPTDTWLKETTISIKSISLQPALGHTVANVVLVARKDKLELELGLTGALFYRGIERVPNGKPDEILARFKIDPLEVAPAARIGPFEFAMSDFWKKLVPDLAVALANPSLFEAKLPLRDRLKFDLGLSVKGTKEVVNKATKATITYDATLPGSKLEQRLSFAAPVFRPEGIWLLARQSEEGQDEVKAVQAPAQPDLMAAVQRLREQVGKDTGAFTGDPHTLSIWIAPQVITSLANRLSDLSDEARRLTVQTVEREGRLAEEKWRDNLLGEGGAYAELVDGRSGTVTVQLGKPAVSWDANGMRLEMPAAATMKAKMHFHFDPLIGGGAGTSVGMEGSGEGTLNISTQSLVLSDARGLKVAAMDTRVSCDAIKTTVTTDGVLTIDLGWIKVPKVGAKVVLPLGRNQIGAVALLDNRPIFLASLVDDPRLEPDVVKREAMIKQNPWALVPPTGGLKVRIVPEAVSSDASGIRATVSFSVEPLQIGYKDEEVARARDTVAIEAQSFESRTAVLLKQQRPVQECAGDAEVAVLLGDIEIGPQNEIVKFAKNAWNDITKGPGPNNDLRKAVEAIGGTIRDLTPVVKINQKHGGLGVQIGKWKF